MLMEVIEIQIILGVLFTSSISGFLGMGGGMILMAIFGMLLPIKAAMILHGVTQFSSNGFRSFINYKHIQWKFIPLYLLGAISVFAVFKQIEFVPNLAVVYIGLGLFPFFSFIPVIAKHFDITKGSQSFICGLAVTAAQLIAGASGAVLDIFFVNSDLDRYKVIATKSMTQTFGHGIKLYYYFSLISVSDDLNSLNFYIYPAVILTAFLGTYIGKQILNKLSENGFKKMSKGFILTIAVGLLISGFRTM